MSTHDIAPETPVDVDEKHLNDEVNTETKAGQLSANQQTLVDAAVRQKSKNLGTFTAIRHYWIAFLWAQFAAFGTILTGYDGTVSGRFLPSSLPDGDRLPAPCSQYQLFDRHSVSRSMVNGSYRLRGKCVLFPPPNGNY